MATKVPAAAMTPAVKPTNDLAFTTSDVPDYIKKGENRGSEEVKVSDLILPRLEIVQALSPIKETFPEEAKEGLLFNTVTQEIIGEMAYIVPIYFRVEFLVWKSQDQGGGFKGSFPTMEQAIERKKQAIEEGENPEYLEVVETPVHFCLRITPEGLKEQIVISFAKSKAKISRKLNAIIQIAGGDRFSRVYKISTIRDESSKGQKFWNFICQPAGFPPEAVYLECERLYSTFRLGNVSADHASSSQTSEEPAPQRGEI